MASTENHGGRFSHVPPCSFKCMQHPEYEAIIAECEPWLLNLVAPPTAAAAQFWKDSLLPLLGSFIFANCSKERAVLATKMLIWFTVSDTADDDLAVRGCAVTDHVRRRHDLILAYGTGSPQLHNDMGTDLVTRDLLILQDIWKGISKCMPLTMQSRYREAVDQYLHALRVQARYRNSDSLPSVDEYLNVVRRPACICLQLMILLEYALDIELDEETLSSELILQLHDAVAGHGGLYNDLFSYECEIFSGDYLNLPSVIFHAGIAAQPGFTFADAVQQAVMMVQEVDRRCAQLMEDIKKSGLVKKPGVEAYLRGLGPFMAGNVEWSSMTARYTHTCSMEGLVVPIERPLSLPTSVAPPPPPAATPSPPPVPIL